MSGIGCLTRDELTNYALGQIAEADAEAIARHLETCESCESTLSDVEDSTDRLIDLCRQPAPLDRYSQEASCHDAVKRAIALGGGFADATEATPPETVATPEEEEEAVLGQMGDYTLLEELSHGGMGTVYRAVHTRLGREVALKVLPKGRHTDQRAVARFEREMAAVGRLDHPHIVRATDAGEREGVQYLAMELIDGFDLTELVDYLGPLSVPNACDIIRQAALGLQCAYEQGLVHRDIKPSNVMVTNAGIGKILDLGLARFHIDKQSNVELTTAGQPMGTADYMAPEQVADTHSVDIRADIYSLGCTFYKILTGQPPFGGVQYSSSFDKMMAHRKETPPPVQDSRPDLPKKLVTILEQMLAKDPNDRFQTPADLADSLYPLCAGANLPEMIERAWQAAESAPMPQSSAEATPGEAGKESSSATAPRRKKRGPGLGSGGGSSTHSASRSQYSNFYVMPPPPKPQWGLWIAIGVLSTLLVAIVTAYGVAWYLNGSQNLEGIPIDPTAQGWNVALDRGEVEVPPAETLTLPPPTRPPVAVRGALGEESLVNDPPRLDGVKSWTLETVGHRAPILSASVDPAAESLATGSGEGAIRVWELGSGDLKKILIHPGRGEAVTALAWTPAGGYLAAAYQSGELLVWDVDKGSVVAGVFETRSFEPDSMAWSPDGTILAYLGPSPGQQAGDDAVHLWNAEEKRTLPPLTGAQGSLEVVAFTPDGSTIAAAGEDMNIHRWDLTSGTPLSPISVGDQCIQPISGLAWSPCATMIASSCAGGLSSQGVAIWNVADGAKLGDLPQHQGGDRSLLWLRDGEGSVLIGVGGGRDGRARYYDLRNGTLGQQEDAVAGLLCRAGSTGQVVLLESNGRARFCEPNGFGRVMVELPSYASTPSALASSPDGKTVACGSEDGLIRFVDSATGEVLSRQFEFDAAVRQLVYSPADADETPMLAVTTDQWIETEQRTQATTSVLNAQSGDTIWTFNLSSTERIDQLAWSPDGKLIATAGDKVRIWSGENGQYRDEFRQEAGSVAWVAGGAALAVGSPSSVLLLDASTGSDIYSISLPCDFPRTMAWSEKAGLLAVTSASPDDPEIVVLNAQSSEPVHRLPAAGHNGPINALQWNGEGTRLFSGSSLRTCVWDIETGTPNWRRAIGTDRFTPDGDLSVATGPSMIRLQQTDAGKLLRNVVWLSDSKYAIISPDGNYTGSSQLGDLLAYVVQTDNGQEKLEPRQFADRFGWKNDPEKLKARQE